MSTDRLVHPLLFPCASKVKIPQVGADESKLRANKARLAEIPIGKLPEAPGNLTRGYLKKISTDLKFSEDVVEQRGAHTLPYNANKLATVYDFTGFVKPPPKTQITIGRHNTRGPDRKHLPCNLKKRHHHLMPLDHKKRGKQMTKEEEEAAETDSDFRDSETSDESDRLSELKSPRSVKLKLPGSPTPAGSPEPANTFLTEATLAAKDCMEKSVKEAMKWEEYLMLSLSKTTARWIASEKSAGPQQDLLEKFLVEQYGEPQHPTDTLLRDDASVSDLGAISEPDLTSRYSREKYRDQQLEKTIKTASPGGVSEDAEGDEMKSKPLISFYRLPGGVRRQHKETEKEMTGAFNATASEIVVHPQKPPPPKTLKDFINPAVGDKVYMTDNQYEQEWLTGARQLHQIHGEKTQIVLDTGNKYKVIYRDNYPQPPDIWHHEDASKEQMKKKGPSSQQPANGIVIKGMTKWSQLPEPDESDRRGIAIRDTSFDGAFAREPDASAIRKTRENPALTKIVDGWRSKWNLSNRWHDSSINDLVKDMSDINDHVRLAAIATIARAATFRPPPDPGIKLHGTLSTELEKSDEREIDAHGVLPEKLLACVEKALYDPSRKVQITGAIALYTLTVPNQEAKRILNTVLRDGDGPERWAAAQCLAHAGVCDSFVVGELIQQIFDTDDMVQYEQAIMLMTKLSSQSSIVHSMVAEQLNSTSWKQRVIACKILPRLHGQINKDLTHKLSNLMWHDWHQEVRKIAAQTLGRTGHGKEVHNDLRDRIEEGSERDRVDALTKIGHLGIMTAKLMPVFLTCFDDQYISVRTAAVNTAGYLRIQDEQIIRKLLFLTQFDSSWKVKAHAIKALGMIGLLTDEIGDALLWALRYETSPGVRAEACHTLVLLGMRGDNVTHMLQDRLLVETDEIVRTEVAIALQSLGVSPSGDMDMVQAIKSEVRRLNTRLNVASKITQNEKRAKREELHERFFSVPREPGTPPTLDTEKSIAGSRASTRLSLRTATPGVMISSEDDDTSLPKTPVSELRDTRHLLTPTPPPKTPGRRTPEEKLEKLIDVYDGVISMKEYKDYVDAPESLPSDDPSLKRKLEDIPETEQEEDGEKEKDADAGVIESLEADGVKKEEKETETTDVEKELQDTSAYHETLDPAQGESVVEGAEVIEMKHASPAPETQARVQTDDETEHGDSDLPRETTDASGQSDTSEESPRPAAAVTVPPTVEETEDESEGEDDPAPAAEQTFELPESDGDSDSDDSSDG